MKLLAKGGKNGKSHYWVLDPQHEVLFEEGNYRRRCSSSAKRVTTPTSACSHRPYHPMSSPYSHVGEYYRTPAWSTMDSSMFQPYPALPTINPNHNNNATSVAAQLQSPSTTGALAAAPSLAWTDLGPYGQSAAVAASATTGPYTPLVYPTRSMEPQRSLITPYPPPLNFAYPSSALAPGLGGQCSFTSAAAPADLVSKTSTAATASGFYPVQSSATLTHHGMWPLLKNSIVHHHRFE